MKIRSARGTHDIFGNDILKLNKIEQTVSNCAYLSGFKQIQTPIFEFSDLFSKPLGEHSDVVLKEMYTFKDRNEDLLTLRPEYTTPMIRAAISNNLLNNLPLKLFGFGPMFRRERPQKGRYRQFNQINFEIFGTSDFFADVELILISNEILKNLLPSRQINLHINTLGTKENLLTYKKELSKYFLDKKHKLSEDSKNKIHTNPLRILDSKEKDDIEISNKAPSIHEYLSSESKLHYENIKKSLNMQNIKFIEDNKLVRGLDYYCNTVFEFKTNELGAQDTLLGGGRYDGLIGLLGGPDIPGIGWAAGIERISMLMETNTKSENTIVHIAVTDIKYHNKLIEITQYLKSIKVPFFWNYKYNLKKSLSKANSEKVKKIIIIGENEFKGNFYTIKNLTSGKQFELQISQIGDYIND